jgi:hypothetical protein
MTSARYTATPTKALEPGDVLGGMCVVVLPARWAMSAFLGRTPRGLVGGIVCSSPCISEHRHGADDIAN